MKQELHIRLRIMLLILSGIMAISVAAVLNGFSNRCLNWMSRSAIRSDGISLLQIAGSCAIGIFVARYFLRDSHRIAKTIGDWKWIMVGETAIWIFITFYAWVMVAGGFPNRIMHRIVQLAESLL